MSSNHAELAGLQLHVPFHYSQSADPGAVGAGLFWLNTTSAPYALSVRNVGNTAWVAIGSVGGGGAWGGITGTLSAQTDLQGALDAKQASLGFTPRNAATAITNSDLAGSIAYGKLSLTGAILNADLAGSIAYSKLSLTGAILNADLAGSIAYSKLSLTGAILNADLAGSIAYSKLSLTGAILNADLAGSIAYSKLSLTGAILNADLAGSIAASKLVGTDIATIGTVTSGGLGTGAVVRGVTMTLGSDATGDIYYRNSGGVLTRLGIGSSTQVLTVTGGLPVWAAAGGGGASLALDNLASVAINTSLLPVAAGTINLGSATLPFTASFTGTTTQYESVVQTAGVVTHAALGSATNINIVLTPKGSGVTQATGAFQATANGVIGFNFSVDATTGMGRNGSVGGLDLYAGGTPRLSLRGDIFQLPSTEVIGWTASNTAQNATSGLAQNSAGKVEFNNGTAGTYRDFIARQAYFDQTVTAGGTTGNQTINKAAGTVNIAASGTTVTVTNSLVAANSTVFCTIRTNDTTAVIKNVVPAAGSFVITLNAAATAEVSIGFLVVNGPN